MPNAFFYITTGARDAWRACWSLAISVAVVGGIAVILLVLLGVRRGLVQDFRQAITKSPSARLVNVWVTPDTRGPAFGVNEPTRLKQQIDNISLIIPDIPTSVWLSRASGERELISISATRPGDPLLAFYGVDVLERGEQAVVLSRAAAARLRVSFDASGEGRFTVGPIELRLEVTRPGDVQRHHIPVIVKGVFEPGGKETTAYADAHLLDWLEDYKQGRSVPELGLPGSPDAQQATYEGYLAFCATRYTADDERRLHLRGLTAFNTSDKALRRLYGVLWPHRLHVYHLRPTLKAAGHGSQVDLSAREVEEITSADDVVAPWTSPTVFAINNQRHRVIGLTVRARWLKRYFRTEAVRTWDSDEQGMLVDVFEAAGVSGVANAAPAEAILSQATESAAIQLARLPAANRLRRAVLGPTVLRILAKLQPYVDRLGDHRAWSTLSVWRRAIDVIDDQLCAPPDLPVAIVSAAHLSRLSRWRAGHLAYDPQIKQFVARPAPNSYTRARVYAPTIDAVPALADRFEALGYATTSARSRVREMQRHVHTLDLLVNGLFVALVVFSTIQVLFVFWDVTGRKRRDIGVWRLLGASAAGVFVMLLMRAVVVVLLAAAATGLVATVTAALLTGQGVACHISAADAVAVLLAALLSCSVGVAAPALYAAIRLSPADAIAGAGVT